MEEKAKLILEILNERSDNGDNKTIDFINIISDVIYENIIEISKKTHNSYEEVQKGVMGFINLKLIKKGKDNETV